MLIRLRSVALEAEEAEEVMVVVVDTSLPVAEEAMVEEDMVGHLRYGPLLFPLD